MTLKYFLHSLKDLRKGVSITHDKYLHEYRIFVTQTWWNSSVEFSKKFWYVHVVIMVESWENWKYININFEIHIYNSDEQGSALKLIS